MDNKNTKALEAELEQFKKEKEQIRMLVGRIGGARKERREQIINSIIVVTMSVLFFLSLLHFVFDIHTIEPLFSIEIAVLLVSLKIIWMMHSQAKVEHFQFWILNSLEFRLNDIAKKIHKIEGQTTPKAMPRRRKRRRSATTQRRVIRRG